MPAFEQMDRHQTALYWSDAGSDTYGQMRVRAAREIMVRWVFVRREIIDADGNKAQLDAEVVMNEQPTIGSLMWQGDLDDFNGTGSGSAYGGVELYEVKVVEYTPDIKNRMIRWTAGLARHGSNLPTVI